ncbi:methyl-accepting chemotaxis protein [Haladaptatus sp. CMAA 1911]|uniref:methyl-accepting chemotaxis protein n=1 Tax=unclassified Haladaptatus TaxID=2622732 RepID=UPI003754B7AA
MTDGSASVRSRVSARLARFVPSRIRRSYAAKFGTVLLAILVLIGGVGAFIHFDTKQLVERNTSEELQSAANIEAESLHEWVNQKRSTTQFLSSSLEGNESNAERQAFLERQLINMPNDVQAIHYVDRRSGIVLASTSDSVVGGAPAGAAWENDSLSLSSGRVTITSPYETNGVPVAAFVTPTEDDHLVVVTASLAEHSHVLSSPTTTGDVTVIDGDGTVVLDNRNVGLMSTYSNGVGTTVERVLSGESDVKQVSGANGTTMMAYTPVVGTDWVLLYNVPHETAFALQTNVTKNIGILVLMAVLALAAVGLTIGRGTAKSLSSVSGTADRIAAGELDIELPETGRQDEMGELYGSFESMHGYLNTVADQADALARQEFDAPVFDESVPGSFGQALEQMRDDLQVMVEDVQQARAEAEEAQADAEMAQDEAEAAQAEAEELNAALERKAAEFSVVMEEAADGDLTRRMATDSPTESMTEIARGFNEMIAELEATIRDVNEFAEHVAAASQEVTASTAEIERASEQVTESTQVMSSGTVEQSERLEETAGEMSELSATIEEVAAAADQVADAAHDTEALGQDGREAASDAIEKMDAIESGTDETVEQVTDLADEIDRIGDVVELIRSIADQTNMLALNASIEAASADGSTEGFEVVADEVKELANETKEAVVDIERRIDTVKGQADVTVSDVRETHEAVIEGSETVRDAQESLQAIVSNVEETTSGIEGINDVTAEQATTTEEVVAAVDEVSRISDETAEEAEDVAAAAEEQTASVSEVARSADALAEQAESLAATVDDFTVSHRDGSKDGR